MHAILPPLALGLCTNYGDDADATPRVLGSSYFMFHFLPHFPSAFSPSPRSLSRAARKMNRVQFVNTNFASQDVIQRKFDQFLSDLA